MEALFVTVVSGVVGICPRMNPATPLCFLRPLLEKLNAKRVRLSWLNGLIVQFSIAEDEPLCPLAEPERRNRLCNRQIRIAIQQGLTALLFCLAVLGSPAKAKPPLISRVAFCWLA